MSNADDQLKLEAQKNEFKKEAHKRRLEYFAAGIVGIAFLAALSTVVLPMRFNDAGRCWGQTVLTTIVGAAIGYVLKTRQDKSGTY